MKPVSSSRVRDSTSGDCRRHLRSGDERVDGVRPEGVLDLGVDGLAQPLLDVGA